MMGHAASTYRQILVATGKNPAEMDSMIGHYYSLAYALMPESLFLQRLFNRQR